MKKKTWVWLLEPQRTNTTATGANATRSLPPHPVFIEKLFLPVTRIATIQRKIAHATPVQGHHTLLKIVGLHGNRTFLRHTQRITLPHPIAALMMTGMGEGLLMISTVQHIQKKTGTADMP
ncbi:hypothetical protein M407DRAFT_16452 [Tulasnella calospora MUT 4182]|uniref:Uncharacterized protein n=1 Tax=Tulasnella calospora MUT 4182 TaxID=1051891 RepID=A0A0C3LK70_9AGAM|nr:hypothetical protein M407DRAFT_16452 [Tulasnella calospora MUT 4182]